jgi:RNase H-like domain found in reverse transcriptase
MAFELLKTLMCHKPVLAQPQYDRPFIVHTDASTYGMGAILLQEGDTNGQNPLKNFLHPIAYYSALFIAAEQNYDIYEQELLAIVKAFKHWQAHLGWTKFPITVVTDHANLAYWKEPKDLSRRMARWHVLLQCSDHSQKEQCGSRLPIETPTCRTRRKQQQINNSNSPHQVCNHGILNWE